MLDIWDLIFYTDENIERHYIELDRRKEFEKQNENDMMRVIKYRITRFVENVISSRIRIGGSGGFVLTKFATVHEISFNYLVVIAESEIDFETISLIIIETASGLNSGEFEDLFVELLDIWIHPLLPDSDIPSDLNEAIDEYVNSVVLSDVSYSSDDFDDFYRANSRSLVSLYRLVVEHRTTSKTFISYFIVAVKNNNKCNGILRYLTIMSLARFMEM